MQQWIDNPVRGETEWRRVTNDERIFETVLRRNKKRFNEIRELYQEDRNAGWVEFDELCESLGLEGTIEELAEAYVEGTDDV